MAERDADCRREPGRRQADPSLVHRRSNPVLALQRSVGNRAVGQLLARAPIRSGTIQIGAVGQIRVKGGNLDEWTGEGAPYTVEVTSGKGRHSAKLERMSNAGTRTDVTVKIAPANTAGEELNVGGGTLLQIKHARIKGYAIEDGVETWRVADFEDVKRTKIIHRIS